MELKLSAAEVAAYIDEVFPQVEGDFVIDRLVPGEMTLRLRAGEKHLRPGGTVSGPAMFALADCAAYYLTLAHVGRVALAVTTSASLDFMRKPAAGRDVLCEARLLKLGRLLSVSDMLLFSEGEARPVARASMTYAIPPGGRRNLG